MASPSLFHHPKTPQEQALNEEKFEWTIHDMSTLQSINLTPHKTQFEESLDSETEARHQVAIKTFFNENLQVHSPMDCALRKQKIILGDDSFTSIMVGKSSLLNNCLVKDSSAQTELSFPSILPPEVEAVMSQFYNFQEVSFNFKCLINALIQLIIVTVKLCV